MGPAERPGGGGASATSAAVAPAEIQILYCFVIVDLSSNEDSLEPFSAQAVIDRHYYGEQPVIDRLIERRFPTRRALHSGRHRPRPALPAQHGTSTSVTGSPRHSCLLYNTGL
jgi:hypothetical protein